ESVAEPAMMVGRKIHLRDLLDHALADLRLSGLLRGCQARNQHQRQQAGKCIRRKAVQHRIVSPCLGFVDDGARTAPVLVTIVAPFARACRSQSGYAFRAGSLRGRVRLQPAWRRRNSSVLPLNAATFSYSGACEQSSKMCSSELLMPLRSGSAKRGEVTASWRPNVTCVGARMLPSRASASCAITAADWRMNASTG